MKYRLKIVPDASPNADGRWIEVEVPDGARAPLRSSWRAAAQYLTQYIPAGEHLVQYTSVIAVPIGKVRFPKVDDRIGRALGELLHAKGYRLKVTS